MSASKTISKVSKEINDFHDPICSDEEKVHLLKQKTRIDEEIVTINVRIKEVRNVLKGNIFEMVFKSDTTSDFITEKN